MPKRYKLSASLEDYVETIFLIGLTKNEVRSKDIIARLNVRGPSVTMALHLLAERGLVEYVPYGPVLLTALGEKVARDVYHRHQTLKQFFIEILGIDPEVADDGACKMEHVASRNIIEKMVQYTQYARELNQRHDSASRPRFEEYLKQQSGHEEGEGA